MINFNWKWTKLTRESTLRFSVSSTPWPVIDPNGVSIKAAGSGRAEKLIKAFK